MGLWNQMKKYDVCINGLPEEEREKGIRSLFKEIMAENLDMSPQNFNPKCYSLRQIVAKLFKNKGKKNFKNSKRKKFSQIRELKNSIMR